MPADYIITGAASPLGRHVLEKLRARECRVVGIDTPAALASAHADSPLMAADVRDERTLRDIFRAEAREYTVVIHAAECMSLSDAPDGEMVAINYGGTKNILDLCAQQLVRRLVYVGSALTLPAQSDDGFVQESESFDLVSIRDAYARSKAAACAAVRERACMELDCVTVLPSVPFGSESEAYPLDRLLSGLARGCVRFGVRGGIDMVDVRDVAQGVLLAADKGICDHSYILSGRYVTVRELFDLARRELGYAPHILLPNFAAKALVKLGREWSGEKPLFTGRSLALLQSGTHYSHDRATRELGYLPRHVPIALSEALRHLKSTTVETSAPLYLPEPEAIH